MSECLIGVIAQQRLQLLQCISLHMHLGCLVGVYAAVGRCTPAHPGGCVSINLKHSQSATYRRIIGHMF